MAPRKGSPRKTIEPPSLRKYEALQSEINDLSIAIKVHYYPFEGKPDFEAIEKAKVKVIKPTFDNVASLLNKVTDVFTRLINKHFEKSKINKLNLLQSEIDRVVYAIGQNKIKMTEIPDILHRLISELDEEREPLVKY